MSSHSLPDHIDVAIQFIDYNEFNNRAELKEYMGVDPYRIEWCAAFVNAVLNSNDIPGSESVTDYPLMARSFLKWGEEVDEPRIGDVVVFPRGASWQGHVGFYMGSQERNGKEYYVILGGNQSDKVSLELYPANLALSIRRHK
jgi:uncharacterized protein (TIGR02594 family)